MALNQKRFGLLLSVVFALTPLFVSGSLNVEEPLVNAKDVEVKEVYELTSADASSIMESNEKASNGIYDLYLGSPGYRDKLLVNVYIYAPGRRFYTVTKYIRFQSYSSIITAVQVVDASTNRTGGYPRLTGGGIGQKIVSLSITSKPSQGLFYLLRIYGR